MGKLKDRLKIIYMNIFFLSLFLSLFYTIAKDFFQISSSSYGLIYLTTLVIALISYVSYHRVNSAQIKEKGHKKKSSTTYKIIWHRIVEHRKKGRYEKEERKYKKGLRKKVEKHKPRILKQNLKLVYQILAIAALFFSLVSIVYSAWIFFVLLLAINLFSFFSLKKLTKTKKIAGRSIMLKHFLKSKKWYETDVDKLLEFINKNKAVKLSDVTSGFSISKEKAEMWGKMLAEHGLIRLYYPATGELRLINNEYKLPHPDARIIFKYFLIILFTFILFVLLLLAKIYIL